MPDSDETIYEVRETGESVRFLTSTAMAKEYHNAFVTINEYDGTYLKVGSAKNHERGIEVKTHPRLMVHESDIENKNDVS